jgi:hypothetical protein
MSLTESLAQMVGRSGISAGTATAQNLNQALAAGTVTATELAAFYLDRIERLNPGLRAVITASDDAAADAAASDAPRSADRWTGSVSCSRTTSPPPDCQRPRARPRSPALPRRMRSWSGGCGRPAPSFSARRTCRSGRTSAPARPAAG